MWNLFVELILFFNTDTRTKSSGLSSFVVGLFLIVSMGLVLFEFNWLLSLLSLTLFLVIFSLVGIVFGFLLYLLLAKIGLIEARWKTFWTIVICGLLVTVGLSSRLNRSGISSFNENEQVLVLQPPAIGENIALVNIRISNEEFTLRTHPEKGKTLTAGQLIFIKRFPGNLGFEVIVK